jgi:NNP family nitrate/nitrite transporter-like MFS transporter
MPFVQAGMVASLFSFPASIIRMLGGWLSDKFGPRRVLVSVFIASTVLGLLLVFPKMELFSPGKGIISKNNGVVISISDNLIKIDNDEYPYKSQTRTSDLNEEGFLIFPEKMMWQEPTVKVGDTIKMNQLIAKGITKINFQANVNIFILFVLLIGLS